MPYAIIAEHFLLGIVGSRTFDDYSLLCNIIDGLNKPIMTIVSGGAMGADTLAARYAKEYGLGLIVFDAAWDVHGRGAGIIRNREIVKASTEIVAFWDGKSRGTAHTIRIANENNVPVHIIQVDSQDEPLS